MAKHQHNIDSEIALTYTSSNKVLTTVAALGVAIGITLFIFLNSMTAGFTRSANASIFKNTPHIRIYKDEQMSQPLLAYPDSQRIAVISNPKIVPENNRIVNPNAIAAVLRKQPDVTIVLPQVTVSVFFNSGKSQLAGIASGLDIDDADRMFTIRPTIVEGAMQNLKTTPNGILLGVGIAAKMSVKTGDNISLTSSRAVTKVMKVVGLFKTSNSTTDKTKSYVNISTARQLLTEGPSYVSDIYVNVLDFDKAPAYSAQFSALTGYKAEDWKAANATLQSGAAVRDLLFLSISLSILVVAGFGIYNILNMAISQKITEIAILKAMGFRGGDVIKIFLLQGGIIGFMGVMMGLLLTSLLVYVISGVYVGGDIGYFPVRFEPTIFIEGVGFGLCVTMLASYMPARNAANVDPVSIFRK